MKERDIVTHPVYGKGVIIEIYNGEGKWKHLCAERRGYMEKYPITVRFSTTSHRSFDIVSFKRDDTSLLLAD